MRGLYSRLRSLRENRVDYAPNPRASVAGPRSRTEIHASCPATLVLEQSRDHLLLSSQVDDRLPADHAAERQLPLILVSSLAGMAMMAAAARPGSALGADLPRARLQALALPHVANPLCRGSGDAPLPAHSAISDREPSQDDDANHKREKDLICACGACRRLAKAAELPSCLDECRSPRGKSLGRPSVSSIFSRSRKKYLILRWLELS